MFLYEIQHRLLGDVDGDYDIDGNDGVFGVCFGSLSGLPDHCELLDLNKDGDVDTADFCLVGSEGPNDPNCPAPFEYFTGTNCDCRLLCDEADPNCPGGGGLAGAGAGAPPQLPPGCGLVKGFVQKAPAAYIPQFRDTLRRYVAQQPPPHDLERAQQMLTCLESVTTSD